MPRLPEPRTPALRELARQLRFQPADASRRQLKRTESLALQLLTEHEPDREWPVEWVVFRITGYRTEDQATSLTGTVRGENLLGDLGALVTILSAAGGEGEDALRKAEPERWLTVEELCARWSVTRQTLDRYRALGLIARRVRVHRIAGERTPPQRALFDLQFVRAFEAMHAKLLKRAGSFSRTDAAAGDEMYRRAARYRQRLGWSLTRIAEHLAPRFDRSVGAVRRAILDADARLDTQVFASRVALRAGGRSEIVREFRRGDSVNELAAKSGRSRASVYRMVAAERARRLRALNLIGPVRPDLADDRVAAKILDTPHATTGLGRPLPHTIAELLEQAQETEPAAARERALGATYCLLRLRSAHAIVVLGPSPTILGRASEQRSPSAAINPNGGIDWIETHLRWASRIKAELVRSQLALLLRTIESQLGLALTDLPGATAVDLVGVLAAALFEAADRHDPFKGGRLAAPAGLALNRAAAKWAEEHPREASPHAPRALARASPSHARLDHIWTSLTPWTVWLEPPPGVRDRIEGLKGMGREVLIARLGWDAKPPRTVAATARELALTSQAVTRAERAAMKDLL